MEISVGTYSSVRYLVEVRYWECPYNRESTVVWDDDDVLGYSFSAAIIVQTQVTLKY